MLIICEVDLRHKDFQKSNITSDQKRFMKTINHLIGVVMLILAFEFAVARAHDGLYCHLGIGPSFGQINDRFSDQGSAQSITWSGTATAVDFRIGGAFRENWILSFDGYNQIISAPEYVVGGVRKVLRSEESISEQCYGAGITRYFMPSNIYVGGTIGAGTYVLDYFTNPDHSNSLTKIRTKYGFSGMLRAGKTFFLGKHWGLGTGLGLTYLKCNNNVNGETETLSSAKFMITVNVTFE